MKWSITVFVVAVAGQVQAGVIFDNGSTDSSRTTWNVSGRSGWTAYDDFVLTETTTITEIQYNIFRETAANYVNTRVSILDDFQTTGSSVIPEFDAVAVQTLNGLTSSNVFVPTGYTHNIEALSITLGPGTYVLGISVFLEPGKLVSIGSGPGSSDTIGPGMHSYFAPNNVDLTRTGDHMSFRLSSDAVVPEPSSLALLATGMLGLFGYGRRRKRKQNLISGPEEPTPTVTEAV